MISKTYQFILACIVAMLAFMTFAHATNDNEDKLQLSGFARVVAGYIDDENAKFNGYENKVSLGQQSLIGLQADYRIFDNVSATAQVIGRTGDDNDSGIEWLYLTYAPTRALQFKLGRQRTPIFSYSDFSDVGFAYNWVSLPQQVYRQFLFPNFDGLHGQYEYVARNISYGVEAYIGGIEQDFMTLGQTLETDIDSLRGVVGTIGYGGWTFRASYHRGHADVIQEDIINLSDTLRTIGFIQSADSLSMMGVGRFYQLSAFYENVDYFFKTELVKLRTVDLFLAPKTNGYFVTGGVNFYPFVTYVSFSRDTNRYSQPISEIPIGVNAQLDQLAFGYQQVTSQTGSNSTVSYTAGIRWNWKDNLSLKAEATMLKERDGFEGLFTSRDSNFDGKAMFYQLALEWVF